MNSASRYELLEVLAVLLIGLTTGLLIGWFSAHYYNFFGLWAP